LFNGDGGAVVNKAELIEALTMRLGDKKTATTALETVLEEIQRTVARGGKISLAGFGVFEKRARAARTARNPRTGEAVKVKKTSVPAFRAGQGFKDVVTGTKKVAAPKKTAAKKSTAGAKKTTAKKATAKKATARKTTVRKATTKKATTAKQTTARKGATRKAAPARGRTAAAKTTARRGTKAATKGTAATRSTRKTASKRASRKA
jgi:DNA-binding protein HU-beta